MPPEVGRLFRRHGLLTLGVLSLLCYAMATAYGHFRPDRVGGFFPIFGAAFGVYALACWWVLHPRFERRRGTLATIFLVGLGTQLILIPSQPDLSDDMYRYIWDGRVQLAGYNPYQYTSNANELRHLRDDTWEQMNRPRAVTIYPPGAQLSFVAIQRIWPDSVTAVKLVFISAVMVAGALLLPVLRGFGLPPQRVLIFLWHPLLIFEIGHAAHLDALYLPVIVGAFALRLAAPAQRVAWRYEVGIGVLLGVGTLLKLYPAILAPCLWSLRTSDGQRRLRLAMPLATLATIFAGYALYFSPDVNILGFLPSYGREFFNVSPLMRWLTDTALANGIPWYLPGNYGMPLLVILVTGLFVLFPARTPQAAILRCFWPMGIYLIVNHNLFSWYVLWLLPLVALTLKLPPKLEINAGLAWWLFSGTVALSYTFFLEWRELPWAIAVQYWPLYGVLLLAAAQGLLATRAKPSMRPPHTNTRMST